MAKRAERSTSSSSSATNSPPSPKRNKLHGKEMEDGETLKTPVTLLQLLDKLNHIENKMEDHFGSLRTEMAMLRCELKEEIEGVKSTMREMEKSLNAAWDAIGDIQEESKASCDSRKKLQTDVDCQKGEILQLTKKQTQLDDHRAEIESLKTKLAEEQEKVISLESYSRRENLRFMNIPEEPYENCIDIIYDIIENELNINTDNMQFQAVHRVGKARSASSDDTRASPRPIIVRFLLREDRDKVLNAKNKLKNSKNYKDIYITQDYARAIQMERKSLIKAMFKARERGLNAKVVNRNLMVNNAVYHVDNIPSEFKCP